MLNPDAWLGLFDIRFNADTRGQAVLVVCKIDSSFFFSLHGYGGGLMKVYAYAVVLYCLKIMELAESAIFPGDKYGIASAE